MMYVFVAQKCTSFKVDKLSRISMLSLPGLQIWDFESPEPDQEKK